MSQLLVLLHKLTFLLLSNHTREKPRSLSLVRATAGPQSLATIDPLSLIKIKMATEKPEADYMHSVVSVASMAAGLVQRVAPRLKDHLTQFPTGVIALLPTETKVDMAVKPSALDAVALAIAQVSISPSATLEEVTTLVSAIPLEVPAANLDLITLKVSIESLMLLKTDSQESIPTASIMAGLPKALTVTCMVLEGTTQATTLALDQDRASALTLDTQEEATTLMANVRAKVTVKSRATVISMEADLVMAATANTHTAIDPKVRVDHMVQPLKATAIAVDPLMDMLPAITAPIEVGNEIFLVH